MPCSLRRRACCEPGTDSMVCAIQGCLPRSLDEFIHLLGHCGRQRRLFECEISSSPLLRFWPPGLWVRLCLLSSGWGTRSQGSGFAAAGSSPPPLLWSECVVACRGEDAARHAGRNHCSPQSSGRGCVSVFNNQRRMQQQRVCGIIAIEPLWGCPNGLGSGMQCAGL